MKIIELIAELLRRILHYKACHGGVKPSDKLKKTIKTINNFINYW